MSGVIQKYSRTENLFNEVYPNIVSNVQKVEISVPNGEYTLSTTAPLNNNDGANLFLLKGNDSPSTSGNGVWNEQSRTITITDGVLKIGYRSIQGVNPENYKTMLNTGSTALPYQPYLAFKDTPYTRLETATDTITALPKTTYNDGTSATVAIKGNMEQLGTPTPSSPITPSECGERTENLCNPTPYKAGYYINAEGQEVQSDVFDVYSISPTANQSYTISANATFGGNTVRIHAYTNGTWTEQVKAESSGDLPFDFTAPTGCDEIRISITHNAYGHIMVNTGSTALPYEPYGYKLPIVSGNTTTNVYLSKPLRKIGDYADTIAADGTVTRKIGKFVSQGFDMGVSAQRSFFRNNTAFFATTIFGGNGVKNKPSINSHFLVPPSGTNPQQTDYECSGFHPASSYSRFYYLRIAYSVLGMTDDNTDTEFVTALNRWLYNQNANGTPVTVWYVLETPTTETTTTSAIPTTSGGQTFDVDTTLKPSEVDLTYHGWHEHEAEKRENGQWG